MISRVVLVKLKAERLAEREAIAAHARQVLGSLADVVSATVGVPADEASARSWDLCFEVRLADAAALERYGQDPTHRAFVEGYMGPRAEMRKAWNFEVG